METKSKHTPGTFAFMNSGLVDCIYSGDSRIAELVGPNSHANGLLFAAAPELLESLVSLLSVVNFAIERSDNDIFGIRHNDAMDAIDSASSAIAKAIGEVS